MGYNRGTCSAARHDVAVAVSVYLHFLFAVLNNVRRGIAGCCEHHRDPKVGGIRRAVRCDAENPRAGKWPRARGPGWAGPRGQRSSGGRKEPGKCFCRERYSISRVIMRKWEAARIRTHRERKERERERERERKMHAMRSSSYASRCGRAISLKERDPFVRSSSLLALLGFVLLRLHLWRMRFVAPRTPCDLRHRREYIICRI